MRGRSLVVPRWLVGAAVVVQLLLTAAVVQQWLFVGTRRLYLDAAERAPAGARQRFPIRDGRVQPEIVVEGRERISFPVALPLPVRLVGLVGLDPGAAVEVAAVGAGGRRVLERQRLTEIAWLEHRLPADTRAVELASEGGVRFGDLRLVDTPGPGRRIAWIAGLAVVLLLWSRRAPARPASARLPAPVLGGLTLAIAATLCFAVLELGLRALGSRLPTWIAASRRDLGEARPDPRWQDAPRYGPRLAANVRATCQWRHGDIVRMGFLAPDLVRHDPYTFPLVTDADGFRNDGAPGGFEVAALGDSFTDALTLPVERTWPALLARRTGSRVRNFGTAGFGPGQQRRLLEEYVLPHRPRVVVVAFFAGNDLQDAERFDTFVRTGVFPGGNLGWKFKDVIARFDDSYVLSLFHALGGLAGERRALPTVHADALPVDYSGEEPGARAVGGPRFERGLYVVPVAGRAVRFAFMPPYLNCLQLSRTELERSPGWAATRDAYREMKRLADAQGTRLAVVFVPSKEQVYLPLVQASFEPDEVERSVAVSLRDLPHAPKAARLLQDRLALNGLVRDFCAREGIAFRDLTPDLSARLATGTNVYFPDDSHWNAAGHEAAAAAIAEWLRTDATATRIASGL
jgi:lysophospholipase L1-like esterase